MLGRMRASPSSSSSVDYLERPPSKIIKHDSLSIYEATLMKLKQGSRHDLSSQEEVVKIETNCTSASVPKSCEFALSSPHDEAMIVDTDCSSASISPSSSDCQSMDSSKQPRNKNVSVLYMFSKYKSSRHALSLPYEETIVENGCSSASILPSSSDCEYTGSTEAQLEQDCVSPLSVFQM